MASLKGAHSANRSNPDEMKIPGRRMKRAFFEAPTEVVAPRLLGKVLAHRTRKGWISGRIVEVEAYLGPHHETADPAAHSYRGPTPRNQVIFGPAGHAYVYQIYGQYYCKNITCEKAGQAGCILIRALEPVDGLEQMARNRKSGTKGPRDRVIGGSVNLSPGAFSTGKKAPANKDAKAWRPRDLTGGPSRLCQALGLTRLKHNGLDLLDRDSPLQIYDDGVIYESHLVTPRIGIRHAVELPLRFAVTDHGCVSGPRKLTGRRIFVGRDTVT